MSMRAYLKQATIPLAELYRSDSLSPRVAHQGVSDGHTYTMG